MTEVRQIGPGWRRPRPLLRTILGDVLRRARQEQGRTLTDVAREANISMPYLSEIERGLKEASSEVLAAVCDALRVDLADVLAEISSGLVRERMPIVVPITRAATFQRSAPSRSGRGAGDVMLLAA